MKLKVCQEANIALWDPAETLSFPFQADYIPGHGDMVDLPIIAAGWDKDRARDLRGNYPSPSSSDEPHTDRPPISSRHICPHDFLRWCLHELGGSGWWTGASVCSINWLDILSRLLALQVPNFRVLFTASYGLDRNQLELLNAEIQLNPANRPYQRNDRFKAVSWQIESESKNSTYTINISGPTRLILQLLHPRHHDSTLRPAGSAYLVRADGSRVSTARRVRLLRAQVASDPESLRTSREAMGRWWVRLSRNRAPSGH